VRLPGEQVLVTGSTAGIGRAVARRLAAEGAAVAITGRDAGRAEAVARDIRAAGGTATVVLADLADESECTRLVDEAADRLGGLTVLVNNAVAHVVDGGDGPVGELSTAAWDATMRVNLSAPMWLCRAAIPHLLRAGHGSIVNVSSRQAERAAPGFTAYVASKAGLNGLTRAIAVDYARHGIRCNTLSPGYVLNERRDADLTDERRARLEGMHLTRLGTADDVAHAVVFLAGAESELLTGTNLTLDGGSSGARGLVLG